MNAIWLASRFEPHVAAILRGESASPPGAVPRTLGAVFDIPLLDLVTLLHQFVELGPPAR